MHFSRVLYPAFFPASSLVPPFPPPSRHFYDIWMAVANASWPAPLSPTGFSSRVKNDNRHPEGCEMSPWNGWCPEPFSFAFACTYGVARNTAEGKRGATTRGRNANKNARKKKEKGGRGRHYALLAGPLIIMADVSAPTLTLIRLSEHRARVTSVSSLPFWRHSTRSASGLFHPRLPSLHVEAPPLLAPSALTPAVYKLGI